MADITRIEAAFGAVAADTDLPGRPSSAHGCLVVAATATPARQGGPSGRGRRGAGGHRVPARPASTPEDPARYSAAWMGGLVQSVGNGISGLIQGAFDAIGEALRGIVDAGNAALPAGLFWVVLFVLLGRRGLDPGEALGVAGRLARSAGRSARPTNARTSSQAAALAVGEVRRLAVEEAVRRARVGDDPVRRCRPPSRPRRTPRPPPA